VKPPPPYESLGQPARAGVPAEGKASRIWIPPHDVQNDFTAGSGAETGSQPHAYKNRLLYGPRHREAVTAGASSGLAQEGYGAPGDVRVVVKELSGALKGYSPDAKIGAGKVSYFSGRTLVATHHPAYVVKGSDPLRFTDAFLPETIIAIVHELTHAFGMPHKCARWDRLVPRASTCFMNYPPNWVVDGANRLVPGTARRLGHEWCGQHLKEVRRVQLTDNEAFKARKWI
jgi:hypothetical protein